MTKCWLGAVSGVLMLAVAGLGGEKGAAPPAPAARGGLALYDTVEPAQLGESVPAVVAEGKWKRLAEGATGEAFQGDAVLANDGLAAIVRRDGSGVELYARGADGWKRRGRLVPVAGGKVSKLGRAKAACGEETPAAVEVLVEGAEGGSVTFGLKDGQVPALKAVPKGKVEGLRIEAPCRLGVLPDFFADDLMVDARKMSAGRAELPSDNFFLHLVGDGAAVLAAVWEKNERDIEVSLAGQGETRTIASTDVFFSSGGSVWAAVLEGKGIWYSRDVTREEGAKGVVFSEWAVPFDAHWKGNFTREDGLIQSELFSTKQPRGAHPLARKGATYQAALRAPEGTVNSKAEDYVGLGGIMAAYPITRAEGTPLTQYCLDDLLRHCLGSQPCAYILDVDSRTKTDKGIFTCSYGATMGKIIPRELPRQERVAVMTLKEERAFIRTQNEQVLIFITHIQDRINVFVDCVEKMLAYLGEQEKKNPKLADFAGRMRTLANKQMYMYGGRYEDPIKKADGARRAQPYLATVCAALELDTPERAKATQGAMRAIPSGIGDPQDLRVAQLRRRIKELRSMATLEMAANPAAEEAAKQIRKWSEEALRNPAGYEEPVTW